ncbi:hypothetical protein FGO68_gene2520 [Halteria grandinella]|uniref:Uncharacterized protein n=1 Tax=Halteria grandinella TaxID=5974 RepID=A0A8J8NJ29_HALGN|nr:hypothetical protein FGO68_gene2520 [Halteria grandinella]
MELLNIKEMQGGAGALQEQVKQIKLIILGHANSGKTKLISEMAGQPYISNHNTTLTGGRDEIFEDGSRARVQFWDPCGMDHYDSLTSMYTRGSLCAVICFDLTDRDSLETVEKYMKKLEENCSDNLVKALVGNKSDLMQERKVLPDEGQKLADHYNCKYFETSAETGENVQELASYLIQQAHKKELLFPTISHRLLDSPIRRGGGGCMGKDTC